VRSSLACQERREGQHPLTAQRAATCFQWGLVPFAFRYQGSYPLPIYWYHSKGNWLHYNFAADSFHIMKLCSRLLVVYCRNYPKDDKFRYLIPILRKFCINEVALQRAEMRTVRWMCDVKVKDIVPSKELRDRLGIDDIILVLQPNRLWWYGHVLWKEDTDWVKKCMEYEVEGSRPRDRPKRTWMMKIGEWATVASGTGSPGYSALSGTTRLTQVIPDKGL